MKPYKPHRQQATHPEPDLRLPQILQHKPGFINQLSVQYSRRNKRQQLERTVKDRLQLGQYDILNKHRQYAGKVRQVEQRLSATRNVRANQIQQLAKQNSSTLMKMKQNKENLDRKQEKERRKMFATETQKLEKSILLRSSLLRSKSTHSNSSRGTRSLSNSMVQSHHMQALSDIERRLEKARQFRDQQKLLASAQMATRTHESQTKALTRSTYHYQDRLSRSVHLCAKNYYQTNARKAELQTLRLRKTLEEIKKDKEKQSQVSAKHKHLREIRSNSILKQDQQTLKRMESALLTRAKAAQMQRSALTLKNKERVESVHTHQYLSQTIQSASKEAILRKNIQDYKTFKVFKTQLEKSAYSVRPA